MLRSEHLVELFRFVCVDCAHRWSVEYDVRHVEDGHGHSSDYFFRNRHPIADPKAPQAVACPACRSPQVRVELTTRRRVPVEILDGPSDVREGLLGG